jgi:hypothetical protein
LIVREGQTGDEQRLRRDAERERRAGPTVADGVEQALDGGRRRGVRGRVEAPPAGGGRKGAGERNRRFRRLG